LALKADAGIAACVALRVSEQCYTSIVGLGTTFAPFFAPPFLPLPVGELLVFAALEARSAEPASSAARLVPGWHNSSATKASLLENIVVPAIVRR